MPNWGYLAINFLYHLGLAVWIGGAIVLGALVAPALFRALPKGDAGNIFGPTLRRFSRLRVVAVGLVVAGAAVKYLIWERHAATAWIAIRWAAIAFLAFDVAYEIGYLEPSLERARGNTDVFGRLHKRSEMLMKSALVAALLALLFS